MRKYLSIMSATVKQDMQSLVDFFIKYIGTGIITYILISLWSFLYEDREVLNGFTRNMTMWYVVIGECLSKLIGSSLLVGGINDDIKSGSIAYKLNKPYKYPFYIMSCYLGNVLTRMIPMVIFGGIFGFVLIGKLETFKLVSIPFVLVSLAFSVVIHAFIKMTIGLVAFWTEDSYPFTWIYEKMLLVFGACFPIDMFPETIQNVVRLTPIYGVIYGPTKLAVDFSFSAASEILLSQIIWTTLTMLICFSIYKRGARNVNVNGG